MSAIGKTPWVDQSMRSAWDRIVAAAPVAGGIPRLIDGKRFSVEEYGCGHYGCVMPTQDPRVVAKLTSDPTEAFFVTAALQLAARDRDWPEGIVRYYGIFRTPGSYRGRPIFVIWREEATDVGFLLKGSYGDRYKSEAIRLLMAFKDVAALVRDTLARSSEPFRMVEQASRHHPSNDLVASMLNTRNPRERIPSWVKGAGRVALGLAFLRYTAQMLEHTYYMDQVGTTLGYYLDAGLLLADVHANNLGLVKDRAGSALVITDPGHAVPLLPQWAQVEVPILP
jgi:hypothetical protein